MNTEQSKLSPKLQRFIEAYLVTWNATEAARIAQYKSPGKQGPRLANRPIVQEAIQQRLVQEAMPANEVLARLAQQARVNMGDFLIISEQEIENPDTGQPVKVKKLDGIDWDMVKSHGYLIKKISWSRTGKPVIELVDNQKALELIGKHQRLFVDQVDMNVNAAVKGYVSVSPDDWDEQS